MIDNMLYVASSKILKDRHDDCTVGNGSNVGNTPIDTVFSDKGDFVTLLYTDIVKQQMKFGYFFTNFSISKCVFSM